LCRTEWIAFSTLPPVADVLRADPAAFQDPKSAGPLYAAAWLLVHRLVMDGAELQRRFLGYLARLSSGAGHESAWRESFGDIGPEELDRKIRAYALQREVPIRRIPHRPGPAAPPASERTLADAEVHLLWASLLPWQRAGAEAARQVAEALRQAPRSAEAHYWKGQLLVHRGRFREAERALRKALELRPDEPRTLWALAWAMIQERRRGGDLRDVEPFVRRLEERAPSPHALNFVAWYWGRAGRPDHGLSVARRALQAAPSCWRCAETMAALFFAKGRPREALALQRRALKMLPPHVSASQTLARLRSYERVAEMREKKHR
jgi:tetratricopeptide (TPR) repeat protein